MKMVIISSQAFLHNGRPKPRVFGFKTLKIYFKDIDVKGHSKIIRYTVLTLVRPTLPNKVSYS